MTLIMPQNVDFRTIYSHNVRTHEITQRLLLKRWDGQNGSFPRRRRDVLKRTSGCQNRQKYEKRRDREIKPTGGTGGICGDNFWCDHRIDKTAGKGRCGQKAQT